MGTLIEHFSVSPYFSVSAAFQRQQRFQSVVSCVSVSFKRALGPFDATMVVIGGIIGSGIFINPYIVAAAARFVGAGARRVGGRRGDRAGRRLLVRGARRAVPAGGRAIRLPARRLPSDRRVSLRLGVARADRKRRDRGGGDHLRQLRAAVWSARPDVARRPGGHRRDRAAVDRQLPGREAGQPRAQRARRPQGRRRSRC